MIPTYKTQLKQLLEEEEHNIEIVNKIIDETKKSYKNYSNFIDNYFLTNKMQYFIDNSLLAFECEIRIDINILIN